MPVTWPAAACSPGEARSMRTPRAAYAAFAVGRVAAFARPDGKRMLRFDPLNVNGVPTVFGVLEAILDEDCSPSWYRVQLPVRPNGLVGYVKADGVELKVVQSRIEIDLSKRRLELFEDGEQVLEATIAIGSPITPTPTGEYYVNQRLIAPDPWGPFGPAAIGISAFSPVLRDWAQGGPIAIHGTNDPSSIGEAISHGCIRVRNETLLRLFERVHAGTPVSIV